MPTEPTTESKEDETMAGKSEDTWAVATVTYENYQKVTTHIGWLKARDRTEAIAKARARYGRHLRFGGARRNADLCRLKDAQEQTDAHR